MSEQRLLLVTGSTGLLGRNVVLLALSKGFRVRALVRSPEKATIQFGSPLPEGLELVVGDMCDIPGLSENFVEFFFFSYLFLDSIFVSRCFF